MSGVLGKGIYSLADVARYTGFHPSRIRRWFLDEKKIFHGEYERVDGDFAVSFLDLIDAYVAGELRGRGVPMGELRRAYDQLKQDLDTPHPFSHKGLYVASGKLFINVAKMPGLENLYQVVGGQHFMKDVMEPYLRPIDYSRATKLAEAWNIRDGIVIKPGVSMGRPVIKGTGTMTHVIASAWAANGSDAALVASLYDVAPRDVMNAVQFEQEVRGRMAA